MGSKNKKLSITNICKVYNGYRPQTPYEAQIIEKIICAAKPELVFLIGDFEDSTELMEKIDEVIVYVRNESGENNRYKNTLEDLVVLRGLLFDGLEMVPLYINSDFKDWVKERLTSGI
jgi:hypothetical protein